MHDRPLLASGMISIHRRGVSNMKPQFYLSVGAALAALALGACANPYSPGTVASANNMSGNTGPSTLSTNSNVVAMVNGQPIPLPYVIYAPQTNASDANKKYGIEFVDYDPCTWGTEHGWTTWPITTFNQLGFYFPSYPSATTYTIGSGGGSTTIVASAGALGTNFAATPSANGYECKAASWLELASGSVTLTAVDSSAGTLTGTVNITLNDGSTVTGPFQSGMCSSTSMQPSSDPNVCTSEH